VSRRERFLRLLVELDVGDYRQFTALVNEYYADPERVMERVRADETTPSPEPVGGVDSGAGDS
jgi:flagellar protein FlaI